MERPRRGPLRCRVLRRPDARRRRARPGVCSRSARSWLIAGPVVRRLETLLARRRSTFIPRSENRATPAWPRRLGRVGPTSGSSWSVDVAALRVLGSRRRPRSDGRRAVDLGASRRRPQTLCRLGPGPPPDRARTGASARHRRGTPSSPYCSAVAPVFDAFVSRTRSRRWAGSQTNVGSEVPDARRTRMGPRGG